MPLREVQRDHEGPVTIDGPKPDIERCAQP